MNDEHLLLFTIIPLLSYQSFCWWGNFEKAPNSLRVGLRTSAPPTSSEKLKIKTLVQRDWKNLAGKVF